MMTNDQTCCTIVSRILRELNEWQLDLFFFEGGGGGVVSKTLMIQADRRES